MGDRHAHDIADVISLGKGCVVALNLQMHIFADKFEVGVAHQRARQQSGFGQNLKAVANAQHMDTFFGAVFNLAYDR